MSECDTLPNKKNRVNLMEAKVNLVKENVRLVNENPNPVKDNRNLVDVNLNLVEDNRKLVNKNVNLVEENPKLLNEHPNPVKENPKLVNKNVNLVDENPKLLNEHPNPVKENHKLINENPNPVKENPKLVNKNVNLVDENPKLLNEHPNPVKENHKLINENPYLGKCTLNLVKGQVNSVNKKINLVNENPNLVKDNRKLVNKNVNLVDENPKLINENPNPVKDNRKLVNENPNPVKENRKLVNENPYLGKCTLNLVKGQVNSVNKKINLVNENPNLVKDNRKLVNENPNLVEDNPKLVNESVNLVNENPNLVEDNPKLVNESVNLVNENPNLVEDNPKLVNESVNLVNETPNLVEDNRKLVNENVNLVKGKSNSVVTNHEELFSITRQKPYNTKQTGDLNSIVKVRPYNPCNVKSVPSSVLVEEIYVGLLQSIIERDFFPSLPLLRLERDICIALKQQDHHKYHELKNYLEKVKQDPSQLYESNKTVALIDGRQLSLNLNKLSLQDIQSIFTSEDNASFEKIIHGEKLKLQKEQYWIEYAAIKHNKENLERRISLELGNQPAQLIYSDLDSRNNLMFLPSDEKFGVIAITSNNDDSLVALSTSDKPVHKKNFGEISRQNTRFENADELDKNLSELQIQKQNQIIKNIEDNAIFDEMVDQGIYSLSKLNAKKKLADNNLNHMRTWFYSFGSKVDTLKTPMRTPRNQNLEFLKTPSMQPGVDFSPIITWGKVASTPISLESEKKSFEVPDTPNRELIAHRLVDDRPRRSTDRKLQMSSFLHETLKKNQTSFQPGSSNPNIFGRTKQTGLSLLREHNRNKRTSATPLGILKSNLASQVIRKDSLSVLVSDSHKKIMLSNNTKHYDNTVSNPDQNITDDLLNF